MCIYIWTSRWKRILSNEEVGSICLLYIYIYNECANLVICLLESLGHIDYIWQ